MNLQSSSFPSHNNHCNNQINQLNQIKQYESWSLQQILVHALNSSTANDFQFPIAIAKARYQNRTFECLNIAIQLVNKKSNKWLQLIQRFAESDFKLVFSICIHKVNTYPALIEPLCKQGDHQRQFMFQTNIETAIDLPSTETNIQFRELWQIYLDYLKNWFCLIPHRTIYALEKIQTRLNNHNHIYQKLLEPDLIKFAKQLARIISFHEASFMKKFQLRKFWSSIPQTILFLRDLLSNESMGLIQKSILTLQSRSTENIQSTLQDRKHQQELKEEIVLFLTYTSEVFILQQTYLHNAERLAQQLVKTYVIDYWTFKEENINELILLENSLIYQIRSDDLPSLIQQLLCSLSKNIPSFLTHFLLSSESQLFRGDLDEISISDIVLKLCILSKQIVYHYRSNESSINIIQIINRLVTLGDSRSELVQIKTLKLMHYFKEILPQKNYLSYHQIIFRVLKRYITNQIQKDSQQLSQYRGQIEMFDNYKMNHSIYTNISFRQCIKILEEQTQKPQDCMKIEMRIRKAKFSNNRYLNDPMRDNENQISIKFIQLISIDGYCPEQLEVFKIYRNFLNKYPTVISRNTSFIMQTLTEEFRKEFQRLRHLNSKMKDCQKLFQIMHCILAIANQINDDSYCECETYLSPILNLLKQPGDILVEKELLTALQILIDKANVITPQLSQFLVYTQQVLKKCDNGMTELQGIIKKLSKPSVKKSVSEEWGDLILMFAKFFRDYIVHMIQNQSFRVYQTQWIASLNLAQLFFQSYQEEFRIHSHLEQILLEIQIFIEKILPSEVGLQLLMTIHHISSKSKIQPIYYKDLMNINCYNQKYSLKLAVLSITDILCKNFKNRIFQYDQSRQTQLMTQQFIRCFSQFRKQIRQQYSLKQASPNDLLPLGMINVDRYIDINLGELYQSKLIDVSQYIEMKNKVLDGNILVKQELFQ